MNFQQGMQLKSHKEIYFSHITCDNVITLLEVGVETVCSQQFAALSRQSETCF